MIYLIIAQAARVGVVWATTAVAKKVLKTVAIVSVGMYLTKRYKTLKERDERRKL